MPILEINNLAIEFETDQGVVEAIDHLTLSVREGQILGMVGESGCGKTTVARSIMGVVPRSPARLRDGEIRFQGEDLLRLSEVDLTARVRGKAVTVIPQDPLASLNPLFPSVCSSATSCNGAGRAEPQAVQKQVTGAS